MDAINFAAGSSRSRRASPGAAFCGTRARAAKGWSFSAHGLVCASEVHEEFHKIPTLS
jgi:hypothetical protein